MDLIDREAALNVFKALPTYEDERGTYYIHNINEAYMRIAMLPTVGWIPCSERMPEKSGAYLASTNMGDVGFAECDWDYEDGMYWSAEYLDVDGIVAWMPLPEPYREGETEWNGEMSKYIDEVEE